VPKGTERLRITPTPLHDDGMIAELRDALVAVWASLELGRELPNTASSETKLNSGDLTLPTVGG
jgi:5-aminolevulinate synthase